LVGLSTYTVYTTNVKGWFSLAMVDEDVADGTALTVVWGEEKGSPRRPCVESHIQTEIRTTLSYNRLNEDA
jgi:vanillate/3-O-methylgallate O-demethylase